MEKAKNLEENEDIQTAPNIRKANLEGKYNIKFSLLSQLFENCTKIKTKSKIK
jgi:hypothetical protein